MPIGPRIEEDEEEEEEDVKDGADRSIRSSSRHWAVLFALLLRLPGGFLSWKRFWGRWAVLASRVRMEENADCSFVFAEGLEPSDWTIESSSNIMKPASR